MSTFCLGCGNSMADGEQFCGACGRDSQASAPAPRVDPLAAMGLPPETSGKAIFSFICGILFIILPFSVIGVMFGFMALSEIRRNPTRLKGRGLAITGISLSFIGVALLVFVFSAGIYGIKKAAQEAMHPRRAGVAAVPQKNTVVSALRNANMAEIAYAQAHPRSGYACALSDLPNGWFSKGESGSSSVDGYIFEIKNCSPNMPGSKVTKYQLLAFPSAAKKGTMIYCTDESDVIRVSHSGSPEDCLKTGRQLSEKELTHSTAFD